MHRHRFLNWQLCALLVATAALSCTTKVTPRSGVGSFEVAITSISTVDKTPACQAAPETGSELCPRPFPELRAPAKVHLHIRALDRAGRVLPDLKYDAALGVGSAQIDVRPGRLADVGPMGVRVTFTNGEADVDLKVVQAYGETRIWVEDCGSPNGVPTYATGLSPSIWFDNPRVDQLNATDDNTTSPLIPRVTNVCGAVGDPRYFLGEGQSGFAFVGLADGVLDQTAGPAAIGSFVNLTGCTRAEHLAKKAQGQSCDKGPIVVSAITNDGFFITDLNPAAKARGFNHVYIFNMSYPPDLEEGDVILSLRGSPVEFSGTTQVGNPYWIKDEASASVDIRESPIYVPPQVYAASLKLELCSGRGFGSNRKDSPESAAHPELVFLEKYEGALICMDGIAPPSRTVNCDKDGSGGVTRSGCPLKCGATLPPSCQSGTMAKAQQPPVCDANNLVDSCLPLSDEQIKACQLNGYIPESPVEYCCERQCYLDFSCTEGSTYDVYAQWAADVFGRYERTPGDEVDKDPVKIAIVSRDSDPDFDPLKFGASQRLLPPEQRVPVRVIGNLRQVLGARPIWVLLPRGPSDIAPGETCPGHLVR
jgi:hypothetical protein